jgi:DNA polymerase kappa
MAASSAASAAAPGVSRGAYETLFTHSKAGMEGVDRERIKQLVFEMSKDSAFAQEQARRDAKVDEQIAKLRQRLGKLSTAELAAHGQRAQALVASIDASRSLKHTWSCVDMDAFYAACEALEDPSLRGDVPFAVGGVGMISTASYAARRYGVRSAMPGFIALRLCKEAGVHLRLVPCDHAKYQRYAELARTAFAVFDPGFVSASCDEAFLDLTDYCARNAVDGSEAARRLREAVRDAD